MGQRNEGERAPAPSAATSGTGRAPHCQGMRRMPRASGFDVSGATGVDDVLRAAGQYGPEVAVPADAAPRTELLAPIPAPTPPSDRIGQMRRRARPPYRTPGTTPSRR